MPAMVRDYKGYRIAIYSPSSHFAVITQKSHFVTQRRFVDLRVNLHWVLQRVQASVWHTPVAITSITTSQALGPPISIGWLDRGLFASQAAAAFHCLLLRG